ncbi:MAG: MoaD/ThiS family protein [Nitrososphaerales archaeon]
MDPESESSDESFDSLEEVRNRDLGRRKVLKAIVFAAAGISVALIGATGFLRLASEPQNIPTKPSSISTSNSNLAGVSTSASQPANSDISAYSTFKVVYFGMATQTTGTKQEYVTLSSPASLGDLLGEIKKRHPVLGPMLPTMQIVINGNPSQLNTQLMNNDEIDFIPVLAGG